MLDLERLNHSIAWIDLSFVERERTPEWAVQVGIWCHLAGMSLRDASQFLEELGVQRSHVAIHDWVHKAELQPLSTVTADQIAVNEKMIRLHGQGPGCTARSIHTPTKRCTPEVREVVCLERAIAEQDATDDFALMIGQRPMVAGLASRPVLGQ